MTLDRDSRLTRRAFVGRMLTFGSLGATALLAACSPAAPPAPAKPAESKPVEAKPAAQPTAAAKPAESKPAAPAAAKTSQLSMILFDGGWTPSLKIMLDKYKADQGVEVVWDAPPLSGFYQKQLSLMLAKEKTPDVISSNDTILSQYAGSGLIEPLDELLADKSLSGDYNWDELADRTRTAASWSKELGQKGGVYGLPFELATWGYFYRSDLIEKPPETFAEYLEVSKKLTRSINPSSPTQYGAAAHAKQLPPQYKEWYAWMWAYGGELFDDKLNPTMNGPESVKSLEDFYGLLLEHKAMPPDTATYSDTEKSAAFQNEVVPHVMHWAHQWSVYTDKEKSPKIADKVKFTMVPGMPGPGGQVRRVPYAQQWMFGLNPNGQNKKEAFKFIAWLTGPVGMRAWVEAGWNSPPRPSLLNDAQFKTKHPSFAVTDEAIKIARYGPTFFKEYAQIADSKLLPAMSQVLAGSQTPKQALDSVAADARDILKSTGY